MKKMHAIFLLMSVLLLATMGQSLATVEWDMQRTLTLDQLPRDVAVSVRGTWTFILTDRGNILVYTADGRLNGTIAVGPHVDGIEAGLQEESLFLVSRKNKTIQRITLDFVRGIDVSNAPFMGPADASVVIVVFNDFQCPYCAKLMPLLKQVRDTYPQEVKVVFKHFPLRRHRFARQAAIAALAAGRQGRFWEFRDGIKAGVKGTPTVFVNGRFLKKRSLEGFHAVIQKELAKTKKAER